MRLSRQLTSSQLDRMKKMGLTTLSGIAFTSITQILVQAQDTTPIRNVEVLTLPKSQMCSNSLLTAPSSIAGKIAMGGASFLVLSYLFMGIAVLTEKLYEAITAITRKSKLSEVKDSEGKTMKMKVPAWSSTMANLTLLAFASALPEIFLSSLSVYTAAPGEVPSELGAMALAGSASFNLLVVAGIAVAFASQINALTQIPTFLLTATFGGIACIWLFVVLTITSAGYVTLMEALSMLLFYPVVLVMAHALDLCSSTKTNIEESRRQVCRNTLQCLADDLGKQHVLEQATGFAGDEADMAEQGRIQEYFKVCLGTEDLSKVPLEHFVQIIEEECPVEFLMNRKSAGSIQTKPLTKVEEESFDKVEMTSVNLQQQSSLDNENVVKKPNDELEKNKKTIAHFLRMRTPTWADQFKLAVNYCPNEINYEKSTCGETFTHVLAFPWKVIAATIPPISVTGGWLAFAVAGVLICGLTFAISVSLATIGCLFNVQPAVQGFVIFSLGSALPKIASGVQCAQAKFNSANSVLLPLVATNVASILLGFGLPYTVSAVYRSTQDSSPLLIGQAETGHIALAVASLFVVSSIAYFIIGFRRWVEGGELGGHKSLRYGSAFIMILMWAAIIGLNATNSQKEWTTFEPSYLDDGVSATQLQQVGMIKAQHAFGPTSKVCRARIEFTCNPGLASPFRRYRIQVRSRSGQFQSVQTVCQQYNRQVMCDIPMSTLTQAPFNLMDGDVISVRASALLRTGWSAFSKVNSGEPKVIGPPAAVQNLRQEGQTSHDQVTLAWDSGVATPETTYDIMQSAGPGSPFTRISFSRETTYSVKNLQPGLTYIFRIRTKNQCNFADSEPVRVTTDFQSVSDPLAVRVTSDRCNVRLSWKSPQPGAGQRFYYQISLQDKQSGIVSFPACGRTFQTSCLFHMQALGNAPTSLTPGDAIIAYVKTCDVYTGRCSANSPMSNKDVLMSQNPPSKMDMPNHSNKVKKADRFIELTWNHVVQTSDVDAKPYVIEMCEGGLEVCRSTNGQYREVGRTNDPNWKQNLTPGQYDYAFRVKACTSCGCSLACDPLPVRVEKLCTMPIVRASTQPCGVQFNWSKPSGCGQLEGFKIAIRGSNSKFAEWNGCAQDATSCTIPFDTLLLAPFELKTGSQIAAQVSALNVVGWSDPSSSNPVYMADLTCKEPSLTRIGDSHTEITVTWTRPSRAQKLSLLWDGGTLGGEMINIPISQAATRHTVQIPAHSSSVDFTFRLDVTCSCNRVATKELKIKLPEKPQAPDLTCAVQKCKAADFVWNVPDDGRAQIQRYSLSIRGINDQWHQVQKCGNNPYSQKCSLSMQELMSPPYNLKVADKIDAKIFASNKVGDGHENMSTPCTGEVTEVWVLPCKPTRPVLVLDDDKNSMKMTVKWDGCPNSNDLTYKLYWDAGMRTPNKKDFVLLTETMKKNEFTVDTLGIDSRFFSYYVEAINPCGILASDALTIERKTIPGPDHKVLVEGVCNVTISVSPPKDNGGWQITGGRYEAMSATGEWRQIQSCEQTAKKSGNLWKCKFPMRQLAKDPFNLVAGDDIRIKACLANKLGCSELNEQSNNGPKMYQIAAQLEAPTLFKKPEQKSIEVTWVGCTEPLCKNELEWGEAGKAQKRAIQLTGNQQTTHVQSNLVPGVTYDFCARSTHSCEKTEWSCSSAKILVKPDPPTCVPSTGKCEAKLAWRAPRANGGTPITKYLVSVQVRDGDRMGDYLEVVQKKAFMSDISMKDLSGDPYNLLPGDTIRYKIRAVNEIGESDESSVCNNIKMKDTNPPFVATPTVSNKNDAGFDVRFNSVIGNEELYCDNGDGVTYSKMVTSAGMNYYRMAITPGVKEYKCFVQASTECGGLGKSNILPIDVTKPPGCPLLRIIGQCTEQKLEWKPPINDGGKPVEGHKFEIETHRKFANGQRMWKEYTGCEGASPCPIDMERLNMPPFSILNGESVAIRASARNANGYGPTCGCSQKILMAKKPPRIWLTASRENNQIKVCWNSPFRAASVLGHKFTLNWGTNERSQGSVSPTDGMDKNVETTQTCHTVRIAPNAGLYRFVVRASNICGAGEYSPEVRVEVAVCEGATCHHDKNVVEPAAPVVPAPAPQPQPQPRIDPVITNQSGGWQQANVVPANTVPVNPYYEQPVQPYIPAPVAPSQPVQPYYPANNQPSQNGWQCPAPVVPPQPTILRQQNVMRTSWCPTGLNGESLLSAEPDTTYELYYASGESGNFAPLAEGPTCEYSMSAVDGQNMKFKVRAKRSCGAVSEWSDVTYDSGMPEYNNGQAFESNAWQTVNDPVPHNTQPQPNSSNAWTNTPTETPAGQNQQAFDLPPLTPSEPVTPSPTTPSSPNDAWTSSGTSHQDVQPTPEFGFGHGHGEHHQDMNPNSPVAWQTITEQPSDPRTPAEGTAMVPPPAGSSWQMNPAPAINTERAQSENGAQWTLPTTNEPVPQVEPVVPQHYVNTSVPISNDGAQWNTISPSTGTPTWQPPSLPTSQGWQSTEPAPTPTHIVSPPTPTSSQEPQPQHQVSGKQVRTSPAYGTCGAIMIEWDRISDTGSPVYQQKVEVKGTDGQFYSANLGCGTRTSMNLCVVSSSTLMKAPYNLNAGDLVVARVSVAFSKWTVLISANTSGAHLTSAKVPAAMQAPIVRKNPDNSFSISWHANSAIPQEYELVWDAGKSWLPVDQLVTKTSSTSFNTQAVVPRNAYRFAARASNQCGTGPYSTPVSIFVP